MLGKNDCFSSKNKKDGIFVDPKLSFNESTKTCSMNLFNLKSKNTFINKWEKNLVMSKINSEGGGHFCLSLALVTC